MRKIIVFILSVIAITNLYATEHDFTLTKSYNIHGNYKMVGNTVLEQNTSYTTDSNVFSDDGYYTGCATNGRVGWFWHSKCYPYSDYVNNNTFLKYTDIDNNSTTFNSSESNLTIPVGSKIIYARLYWTGMIDDNDDARAKAKNIKIKINNGNYIDLSADTNTFESSEGFDYIAWGNYDRYIAYKDVTNLFENLSDFSKPLQITVANLYTKEGWNYSLGFYGAWNLVVVYKNSNESFKNISVFTGYKDIDVRNNANINISGFYTPINGAVKSEISVFASEGDLDYTGDHLKVADKNGNLHDVTNNTSYPNAQDNIFDSTITNGEGRNPDIENNMGIDIDTFPIGVDGDDSHPQIIGNNQTSTTVEATTDGDVYTLNCIIFSTELYVPKVCYDNLKFYDENGNEITDGSQISVGSKIKVSFDVKNMDNETAKNVYIRNIFDNNITSYIPNSTDVQNVLTDTSTHIDDNETIGSLGVYYADSNKTWDVGILGDSNNAFLPTSLNSGYIAKIDFNESVDNDGNISFNPLTNYIYSIGSDEFTYDDILPKCSDFNSTLSTYSSTLGTFDAWDVDRNINDKNITTKIASKSFSLTLASLDENNQLEKKQNVNVKYSLMDMNRSTTLTPWGDFNATQNKEINASFSVNKAVKDVKVVFDTCSNYDGTNYTLYPYEKCTGRCSANDEKALCWRYFYSSDNFAIRPNKFIITNFPTTTIRAGKEFNITIDALDYNNTPTLDYNETLTINSVSPAINYQDKNSSCLTGMITSLGSLSFKNGEANVSLKYSEIGDLNLTIQESNDTYNFAAVDAKDSSLSEMLIQPYTKIIAVLPYEFNITNTSITNYNNANFTYLSNDLNMSGELNATITAVNANGATTQNYSNGCYAQNLDINVSHLSTTPMNNLNYIITQYGTNSKDKNISFIFPKTNFSNGSANIHLLINFDRNSSKGKEVEPFEFNITQINLKDTNDTNGSTSTNGAILFEYGRADVQDISSNSNVIDLFIPFEIWKNGEWIINTAHNNKLYGDTNNSYHTSNVFINYNESTIANGQQDVTITKAISKIPYKETIHFGIPTWLWYSIYDKTYQAPSSTNQDCTTHPCSNVLWLGSSHIWAGTGTGETENNVTTKTINSAIENNTTKNRSYHKINW